MVQFGNSSFVVFHFYGVQTKESDVETKVSDVQKKGSDVQTKVSDVENNLSGVQTNLSDVEILKKLQVREVETKKGVMTK